MGDFMRIKTFAQTKKYTGNYLMDRTVIVVDVLRATSSIIWACRNGANRVIPVSDAGEGAAIAARLGDCIMAGERGGVKLPGFDLGNSPLEFDHRIVKDRNVVINTTNGTGAIKAAEGAAHVLIGAMINHTAVARMAAQLDRDVIILCAGTEGEFSADDICARRRHRRFPVQAGPGVRPVRPDPGGQVLVFRLAGSPGGSFENLSLRTPGGPGL